MNDYIRLVWGREKFQRWRGTGLCPHRSEDEVRENLFQPSVPLLHWQERGWHRAHSLYPTPGERGAEMVDV